MARIFLDSSALVKRFILEEGTPRVLELLQAAEPVVVSRLAMVEVACTIVRRTKAGDIATEHLDSVLQTLDSDFRTRFDVIELGGATMMRALDVARTHGLRAADAIQLACALVAKGGQPGSPELVFVSSDTELNAAAEAENLSVLDPRHS